MANVESVTKSPCAKSSDEKNLAVADGSAFLPPGRSGPKRDSRKALCAPAKLSQRCDTAALAAEYRQKPATLRELFEHTEKDFCRTHSATLVSLVGNDRQSCMYCQKKKHFILKTSELGPKLHAVERKKKEERRKKKERKKKEERRKKKEEEERRRRKKKVSERERESERVKECRRSVGICPRNHGLVALCSKPWKLEAVCEMWKERCTDCPGCLGDLCTYGMTGTDAGAAWVTEKNREREVWRALVTLSCIKPIVTLP